MIVEGYGTVRFDNVQAARKAIEETEDPDLEGRILLLLYYYFCTLCATIATPVSSMFANSPIGMAFFLIVCGSVKFCSSPRESSNSGLFTDGGGVWNCEV